MKPDHEGVTDASIEREIQAKGLTAPRITPADIGANIASEHYFTAWEGAQLAYWGDSDPENPKPVEGEPDKSGPLGLLTFCVLVLRNGFTVTGESACASPENFDAEIGRKIARQNAIAKIWPLMGYALKEQLHTSSAELDVRKTRAAFFDASVIVKPNQVAAPDKVIVQSHQAPAPMMRDGSPADPEKFGVVAIDAAAPAIPAYQQRVIDEKRDLDEKLSKLGAFIDASPVFNGLPNDEKEDLAEQHGAMYLYSEALGSRIARFGVAA